MFLRSPRSYGWLAYSSIAACAPETAPEPVVITATANGSTVQIPKEGLLVVRLPSNGTTGYTWAPTQIPKQLKLLSDDYRASPEAAQQPPIAGAGGTQELRFAATKEGRGSLVLTYRPAWDGSGDAAEAFKVTTQVGRR